MLQNKVAQAAFFVCLAASSFVPVTPTVALTPKMPECSAGIVHFNTPQGLQTFRVEVADDEQERSQGLMFRQKLADDAGMLFIYDQPRRASFWMRNTYIPLDLIFMDQTGVIRHIHHNARPLDETPIPGAAPGDPNPERLMILEIAGGGADRHGLRTGQAMAYPRLDPKVAAWPCS